MFEGRIVLYYMFIPCFSYLPYAFFLAVVILEIIYSLISLGQIIFEWKTIQKLSNITNVINSFLMFCFSFMICILGCIYGRDTPPENLMTEICLYILLTNIYFEYISAVANIINLIFNFLHKKCQGIRSRIPFNDLFVIENDEKRQTEISQTKTGIVAKTRLMKKKKRNLSLNKVKYSISSNNSSTKKHYQKSNCLIGGDKLRIVRKNIMIKRRIRRDKMIK